MKKRYMVLALSAFVLASCGTEPNKEPAEPTEQKILRVLTEGYRATLNFETSEQWGEDVTVTNHVTDLSVMPDYTSYVEYEATKDETTGQVTKGNMAYNTTYSYKEIEGTDSVVSVTLGLDNVVRTEVIQNTSTGEAYKWESLGFDNGFKGLKVEDLTLESEGQYKVNFENLSKETINNFSVSFYGMSGYEIDQLKLGVNSDGDLATIAGVYKQTTEDIMGIKVVTDINFTGTFNAVPKGEKAVKNTEPLTGEEDATFASAMKKLQTYNWKGALTTEKGVFGKDEVEKGASGVVYATPEAMTYETYYANGGLNTQAAIYKSNGKGQQVAKIGDNYYKNGSEEYEFPGSYLPSFEISSLFFDKNGDTYTLNHDRYYNGYDLTYVFSTLYGAEVTDLSIKITDESVVFNNFVPAGAHTASARTIETYTDFGKQANLIDTSKVKDTIAGLTWVDIFKSHPYYSEVLEVFNNDETLLKAIPTTEDNHSVISLFVDAAMGDLQFQYDNLSGSEEGEALCESYKKILVREGYSEATQDKWGTYSATKVVNGKEITVSFESDIDYNYGTYYFMIMPSVADAA